MYERNAIILDRYFNEMFGYNMKNNIKTNFYEYCDFVECLERYKDISDDEDNIMQEYDLTANKIREIQKKQDTLNKKMEKYLKEREEIFQNIDENIDTITKKIASINNNIQELEERIRENANEFVDIVVEFNDKSAVRTSCGKSRRNIESDYNNKLNSILDDYKNINIENETNAKKFIDVPTEKIEKELKEKIMKNGENEKIPFNEDVIKKAISLSVDIQKRETEILANIYDKTAKLFAEIKNNSVKEDRHKKIIRDSKCKLEFVNALKEYLILFLDNERLTAVNSVEEHENLMKESCKNLEDDLIQINNLYTLLLKEISKKIAKKSYPELYNLEYLRNLERKSADFENQIKKLNLPVTIINPNYWRIEGMKKIYDTFYKSVTEIYGRDLSEYMPKEIEIEEFDENDDWEEEQESNEDVTVEPVKEKKEKRKIKNILKEENNNGTDIDKKIDMILGFGGQEEQDDEWDEEDYDDEKLSGDDDNGDNVYYDIWGNDIKDTEGNNEDYKDNDEWDEEDNDEYFEDEDDDDFSEENEDEYLDEYDEEYDEEDDDGDDWDDDDDWDEDFEEEEEKQPKVAKNKKDKDNWEDEFVEIETKDKTKKKKGFFDKFRK